MDIPDSYKSTKKRTQLTTQEIRIKSTLLTDTATGPILKSLLFTVADPDHRYFVSRVWMLLDQIDYFLCGVYINGLLTYVQTGTGSILFDNAKEDPIPLHYGDYVTAAFYLFEAKAYTVTAIFEYYTQPTFDNPVSPVVACFQANRVVGGDPLTVLFQSYINGNPTTYDWDFGDGSSHSFDANPTHVYSTPGLFTPSLYAYRADSWDKYYAPQYVKVIAREDLTTYTEVDANNILSTSSHALHLNGGLEYYFAYLLKDFGVNHFKTYHLTWSVYLGSIDRGPRVIPLVCLLNSVSDMWWSSGYKIATRFYFDGVNYTLDFLTLNNQTITNIGQHVISPGVVYYCDLFHSGDASNVYFHVYSDAAHQNYLFGFSVADGYGALSFRYLMAGSSWQDGNVGLMDGYVNDLAVLQGDP